MVFSTWSKGSRESGVGSRESGVGSRESGVGSGAIGGMGILRGTGILPVSCLFSGVELASCQFDAYFRAWNWHLASLMLIFGRGTGILPVSCLFSGVELAS
ncbi:hypothetical protein [Moorena producens]|uniref:hypothetical protein n=1 Tax=Moorena producens TaxID=1155739 RepID=UPI003C7427C2